VAHRGQELVFEFARALEFVLCAQDGKGKGLNLFVGLFQFRGAFRDAFLQIVASLSQCLFILLDLPSISLKGQSKPLVRRFHRLEARGRNSSFHERPLLQLRQADDGLGHRSAKESKK